MPDLTAQQLADIMLPLFEREPELRVDGLQFVHEWWHLRSPVRGQPLASTDPLHATQLCESSMVRQLIEWGACPTACKGIAKDLGGECIFVRVFILGEKAEFYATTLVAAFAAACTAVLDAKQSEVNRD